MEVHVAKTSSGYTKKKHTLSQLRALRRIDDSYKTPLKKKQAKRKTITPAKARPQGSQKGTMFDKSTKGATMRASKYAR